MRWSVVFFVGLVALVVIVWQTQGRQAADNMLILLASAGVYFLPTIVAYSRKAQNPSPAFVVNLFLGWTLIGWVVALAMAAGAKTRGEESDEEPTPRAQRRRMKRCPSCAEDVLAGAAKCRYCGHQFALAT